MADTIITLVGTIFTVIGGIVALFFKLGKMSQSIDALRGEISGVKTDMSNLKTEMKGDMATLRTDVKGDIDNLRWDVKSDIDNLRTEMKSDMAKLPCAEHHDNISGHQHTLDGHTEILRSNNNLLNVISKWVMKQDASMIEEINKNTFYMKASPRKLNPLGERVFAEIKGEEFLQSHKEELFRFITDEKPLVALDVEQNARLACASFIPTPDFNDFKDYVYNEPSFILDDGSSHDITVRDICNILGLRLRDMYLEQVFKKDKAAQ